MPPKKSKKSNKHNQDWDSDGDTGEFNFVHAIHMTVVD